MTTTRWQNHHAEGAIVQLYPPRRRVTAAIWPKLIENAPFESCAVACRRFLVDRLKMAFGRQTGMQAYARDGVRMYDPFHPLGGHGMDGLGFGTANHHGLGRISSYCSLAMEQLSGPDIVD